MTKPEIGLHFGPMVSLFRVQLEEQGFKFKIQPEEEKAERLHYAINLLNIHGIMTDGEAKKARKRLFKRISKLVVRIGEEEGKREEKEEVDEV